jgi:tetratricopeptide (TPR) repeat protein
MDDAAAVIEALRRAQRGDAAGALTLARDLAGRDPGNGRAHMAAGIALRMLGRLPEARAALERAAALQPADYAAHFELAVTRELAGETATALAAYQRALALRPGFAAARFGAARLLAEQERASEALALVEIALRADPADPLARHEKGWILHRSRQAALAAPLLEAAAAADPANEQWQLDAAKALADAGRDEAARAAYERAARVDPAHAAPRIAYGRFLVSRADYEGAAGAFTAACALDPTDTALPIYLAQVELLLQHWETGWRAYGERELRRAFAAARGLDYRLPPLEALTGREVTLVGEQGLGDALFFLRFAPQLTARGARLEYAGDARLAPLLERIGLFGAIRASDTMAQAGAQLPILAGDLPALPGIRQLPRSLRIAPRPERLAAWRAVLEAAGPRPWIGIAWRAGTPADVLAHGLYKSVPLEDLCRALRPLGGTVLAIQRNPRPGEIDAAAAALGRPVPDLTRANEDLEDVLALVALLDRHVAVSNTNIHLAAAAGAVADVLVPFPPEWRWTAEGDSPWYPGFRVHRQERRGDWSAALARL